MYYENFGDSIIFLVSFALLYAPVLNHCNIYIYDRSILTLFSIRPIILPSQHRLSIFSKVDGAEYQRVRHHKRCRIPP